MRVAHFWANRQLARSWPIVAYGSWRMAGPVVLLSRIIAVGLGSRRAARSGERILIIRVPHLLRWRRSLAVCDSQCGANVAARVVTAVGGQKAGGRY